MKSCMESIGLTRYVPGIIPWYLLNIYARHYQKDLWDNFELWIHGAL